MVKTTTLPTYFPAGYFKDGEWKDEYTRKYPASMDITSHSDHLASASGAYERYQQDESKFTWAGCWVEDIRGLPFDEMDIGYLDYCLGNGGLVSRWIAAYAQNEGKARWTGRSRYDKGSREVGWMYENLETLLTYQARRGGDHIGFSNGVSVTLDDGYDCSFIPVMDATDDDGWLSGATWNSERVDWTPGPERAHQITAAIAAGRLAGKLDVVKRGEQDLSSINLGKIKWASLVVTTAGQFRSRWIPVQKAGEEISFLDRHCWDAVLHVTMELRELLTRTIAGPDAIDSEEPVACLLERLDDIWRLMPSFKYVKQDKPLIALCQAAELLAEAILRKMVDWIPEPPAPVEEENPLAHWLMEFVGAMENQLSTTRTRGRRKRIGVIREYARRSTQAGPVTLDYASCYRVG